MIFSSLDLSGVEILENSTETILFRSLKETISSKTQKLREINESIKQSKDNYANVLASGNEKALAVIKKKLDNSNINKSLLLNELYLLKMDLYNKTNYYEDNDLYIKNRNIIEGIRNSIAHGNVEVVRDDDKVYLLFNDIYEGKLTFSCRVEMNEFARIS